MDIDRKIDPQEREEFPDKETPLEYQTETGRYNILGFWMFLGAEIALFATLFGTYFVLIHRTASGVMPEDVFNMGLVLTMTFLLLTSSFTSGLAIHEMRLGYPRRMMIWVGVTLLLGLGFLGFEIYEFVHFVQEGATLESSAFWSAFFVLLGTHGLHVALGIAWFILIIIQVKQRGLIPATANKMFIASLYWHFLDVIWVFIFTGVYLLRLVIA
ncbi:cytochrome aa3-600 menaquinol oxidase subunit 3 [Geomicrobium halophilum]|uniref:Quinol oxidase subunit 3 n=1 Tax=Geomicrobium halophilum TaxID=549000 RepID=A0A841PPJ1_9BACL|nr:cytochrome aa3 quinol oxidase subunit III [Geomicrobium halophilum]MBB6450747.1 cytochrome aa3-600 menaquinol oxidase subunit 3 [Geomicrobium halophilum]